ncbi:ComEA family DNA-binding protein [Fodinibius salsisoli]|uniref:Helix-hairpin-helix domain-containing protein n=1 Tax=Fodinibius salsisoli TaxID=2820877 RepID=A0ABT3PM03_9BACT|nr:helix-hairpin-helix domain-containing protein [Fodinibius salsisoli]MCW9706972.1 helix-hairpin-helix domain-containing protein [Fodinibius salsisoli]
MKRRIFFFLERLKVTPAERKAISTLMVLLILLAICNLALKPSNPLQDEQYAELKQRFQERTAKLQAEKAARMERYFPPERKAASMMAIADTIEADTTDEKSDSETKETTTKADKSRINVNKADRETLKTLPGIGPAYSKRIIEYRQKNGGFKTIEELKKIKGIGEKRLEKLKPFVKLKDPQ